MGTFVFAPIAAGMLEVMSWDQANLIFAGVILLCGVSLIGYVMTIAIYFGWDQLFVIELIQF